MNERTPCCICGDHRAPTICDACWHEAKAERAKFQRDAIAAGRRAEAEGWRVIYVHGQPYLDPDAASEAATSESPFPWDLWDDIPKKETTK